MLDVVRAVHKMIEIETVSSFKPLRIDHLYFALVQPTEADTTPEAISATLFALFEVSLGLFCSTSVDLIHPQTPPGVGGITIEGFVTGCTTNAQVKQVLRYFQGLL
jgi:hypothetical protein